ncbi:MAG: DUF5522 domain-containing protein [Pyrinomonadaceae bacterium]
MINDKEQASTGDNPEPQFLEGVHYYFENGLMVLTARFLRERGYCCNNGCCNCPYPKNKPPEI